VRRRLLRRAAFVAEASLLTVFLTVAIQAYVVQPYRVERESMMDTLQDGQMVLVDKLSPGLTGIARGDIVVFRAPPGALPDDTPFIKRVVGLPGDLVELVDGTVVVDGVPLDEAAYVFHGQRTVPTDRRSSWVVPAGHLFVLGDHRMDSLDSRSDRVGMIPAASVIGRAAVRYWPLESLALLGTSGYPELRAATGAETPPTRASPAPG
jgi:signal peptidase I